MGHGKKKKGPTAGKGSTKSKSSHTSNKQQGGKYFNGKTKHHKRITNMDVTEEDCQFRNSLESDGLTIVQMAPDGNCLFRALSDQLYGDYGNMHEEIRSDICDYIQDNKEDFQLFLVLDDDSCEEGDDGKDFESYIETMRQDGEWGGNLELVAAARLYQRKVTVYSATLSLYSIEPGDEKPSRPDILLSFHDNDHYNSVRDEKSPPKPPTARNISKSRKSDRQAPESVNSEASDSICTNSTATVSLSDTSIDNNSNQINRKLLSTNEEGSCKPVKKGDPCPCGNGQKYRKCCLAKDKLATAMRKVKGDGKHDEGDEAESFEDRDVAMKGKFHVLQI